MAVFKQPDMLYSYRWNARPQDNPGFRKGSEYRNFNRSEGYEVLFTINEFLNKKGLVSAASGRKAEKLIHDKLPSRVFSHAELYRWLNDHW